MRRDSVALSSSCGKPLAVVAAFTVFAIAGGELLASISYTTVASNYTQDFNSLPISPASFPDTPAGWTDDNSAPAAGNFSIPGWYLYHASTQAEGGFNGHQRFRTGTGSSGTGSFYSFGAASNTERALGNVGSNTVGVTNMALRLTNDTGVTLGRFTLSYTGEQWRDGASNGGTPAAQTMTFGYAVTSTPPANISTLSINSVGALNFTSPTFVLTTATGAALNGNDAANRTAKSATVAGLEWLPGQDLWLRWNDVDHAGNDHGLSIDDLTFSADVPVEVLSIASGPASSGSTWDDGQPAGPGKGYHIVSGHTVTLDSPFLSKLAIENGTADINAAGNGQFFQQIVVESGGNLTESVTGDVQIGNDSTSAVKLNRDVAFNLDANSNFRLKATLSGAGNLDLNEASPGSAANAQVFVEAVSAHTGIIRFNAGKQFNVVGATTIPKLEMNSTESGGNILWWEPTAALTAATITFNQPGTFVQAASATSPNLRLQSLSGLIINAATTVDMSSTYSPGERRLITSLFQGNGSLLVKGTPNDPTDPTGAGITLNEFEIGVQGTDPAVSQFETYSGTLSTQDYINVEVRRNIPFAKLVVNDKGRVDTGGQDLPLPVNFGTQFGEVVVNGGGVFEVGFEQANATSNVFREGHQVNHVTLTSFGGRTGSLTLTGGATPSTLRMQINGTNKTTEYDYIDAHGIVTLDGTLDVLINPLSCEGNDPCQPGGANPTTENPIYSPTLNDTFEIINLTAVPVQGDYDVSGTVDNADYTAWQSTFGNTTSLGGGADGNRNGVVDAGDYVIWLKKFGATGTTVGSITGTFDTLNIVDPNNTLANSGFTLALDYTNPLKVLLKVVTVGSGSGLSANVPEPTTFAFLGLALPALLVRRRRSRR